MQLKLQKVLQKSKAVKSLDQVIKTQPNLGWVTINALGELLLHERRPTPRSYHWLEGGATRHLGWLRGVCRIYGQRGKYGRSAMDEEYLQWCWTVQEFQAAMQQPVTGSPRTRQARLKKALEPVMRGTAHLQDFWL